MNVITVVGIALLGVAAAVGAATVLRRRIQAAREMPVVKVQDNETGARILRADGRLYWKFYDEYGAAVARTTPTLLPWGRVFHRDLLRQLRANSVYSFRCRESLQHPHLTDTGADLARPPGATSKGPCPIGKVSGW